MKRFGLLAFLALTFLRTNAQIDFSWAYGAGSVTTDFGNGVVEDNTGAIISTGYFADVMDFDPGPANVFINPTFTATFVTKLDPSGDFSWVKCFDGDGSAYGNSICTDAANNIYVAGHFDGTIDFNPNAGTFNMTSAGLYDTYIVKLTENGGFVWAKQLGGVDNDAAKEIALDAAGNIYMTGYFRSTADLEAGPGVTEYTSNGTWDMYITKLDNDGNTTWSKAFGGAAEDILNSIVVAPSGNIYVSGYFRAAVDFDPDAGDATITSPLGPVVAKYANDGSYVWAKSYGSSGYSLGVAIDADENVINVGYNPGGMDLDPGPGTVMAYLPGFWGSTYYISKLNSSGDYLWGETFGGPNETNLAEAVTVDDAGNIYVTGYCAGTFDADPGPGVFTIVASSQDDIFMHKLDAEGNFLHAFKIGGGNWDRGEDIKITSNNEILMTGVFDDAVDFDPGPEIYYPNFNNGYDVFVTKFTQDVCANLAIVVDTVVSIDCVNYEGLGVVHGENTFEPYTYSWTTVPATENDTVIFPGGGWYSITVTDAVGCTKSSTLLVDGPTELSEMNFNVNLSTGIFRPGTPVNINVDAYNAGCFQASGQCMIVLPQIVEYNTADPLPDLIAGDTLIWNFSSITYESEHITPVITATTVIGVPIGTPVLIHAEIGPNDGDTDTTNNVKDYSYEVQNSFDPNDKQVFPQGACDKGYILNNQEMTYTVRFQNTGTLDAINIYIIDTISTYLDLASIQVVGASHSYVTELLPGDIVKFRFDNIHLPDSTTNEPESHGYITYVINQNPDLPNNTKIKNTAAIYFDYNDPVITNTVLNTIVNDVNTYASTNAISICEGDSIIVGYHTYKVPGTYVDVLSTNAGCDSTVTTILSVGSGVTNAISASICSDEEYVFNGISYIESGIYEAVFAAANGCDSVVQLTLDVKPAIVQNLAVQICPDDTYNFNGELLNEPGIYQAVYAAANGCDSTVYLELSHESTSFTPISASICSGEIYLFEGLEVTDAGYYEMALMGVNGCDSIIGLTLAVNESYLNDTYLELCNGDSAFFNGSYYSDAGDYSALFSSVLGCDSIEYLHISLLPEYTRIIDTTICSNELITFEGNQYSEEGVYTASLSTVAGCDSIITLNLHVTEISAGVDNQDTALFALQEDAVYQWIDCDNGYLPVPGATDQFFQPETEGNYAVVVKVEDCIDTSACYSAAPLGMQAFSPELIVLYPNPAGIIINIELTTDALHGNLSIYNALGQIVYVNNNLNEMSIRLDIVNWQSGCYFLQYSNGNAMESISFIKQ